MVDTSAPKVTEEEARAVAEEARESGWDKPSFAKELFLGRFRLDLVHPFPPPGYRGRREGRGIPHPPPRLLRGDGRQRHRIPVAHSRRIRPRPRRPRLLRLKISEEYGGLGLSQVAYNRALMLVASVHPSLGALLSAHQSIGVPEPLKLAGTPEQKREFLPRCARGAISAFLLTEPDVGSDPARLASSATRSRAVPPTNSTA